MITKEQLLEGSPEAQLCLACSKLTTYVKDEEGWHINRCGLKSPENFRRIHIIGGPGSGKTTLAREIKAYLGIEAYELDKIAFTGRDYEERPYQDRQADIHEILSHPAWITEGLFVRWTDELLARANIVVWLDNMNWQRGFRRITRRFVNLAISEARRRHGWERSAFSRLCQTYETTCPGLFLKPSLLWRISFRFDGPDRKSSNNRGIFKTL